MFQTTNQWWMFPGFQIGDTQRFSKVLRLDELKCSLRRDSRLLGDHAIYSIDAERKPSAGLAMNSYELLNRDPGAASPSGSASEGSSVQSSAGTWSCGGCRQCR